MALAIKVDDGEVTITNPPKVVVKMIALLDTMAPKKKGKDVEISLLSSQRIAAAIGVTLQQVRTYSTHPSIKDYRYRESVGVRWGHQDAIALYREQREAGDSNG